MAQHANRSCSIRENQPKNLLTDEVPSFSLGLTQDEVFNLGSTNVFSKEGVTIEELRSKHHNDPEKIVIHDQIFMARVLPKFAPHIRCHTVNDIEDCIKTMLTKSQYKMFCTKSIFSFFVKKKDCVVQAQIERCIMSLETRKSSTSAIVIRAKVIILYFTIREFALVTSLNCATNKDEFVFDEEHPNRIIDQYFDVDTVAIPCLHFDLVESGCYSDYPWGSIAFEELARSLHKKLKPKGKFYMLLGMPLAIQIWLYECCSNVPRNVASKVDSQIPRILNWKTNSPHPRYETVMGSIFDDTDNKSPAPPSFSSEDEDGVVSKKVFDKFCEKVWQEFNDVRGLVSSRFDQMMNAINENKKKEKGSKSYQPPADENVKSTSPHQATTKFVHEFNKNPEGTLVAEEMAGYQSNSMNDIYKEIDGYNEDNDIVLITKSVDESIGEAQISESQLTFLDDVLRSIDLDSITKANVEVEDEFKNKEGAIEMNVNTPAGHESEANDVNNSKLDKQYNSAVHIPVGVNVESNADQHLSDSQNTLPSELFPSFNTCIYVYDSLSAAGHDAEELTEIEKLTKVIPICLIECKFYENKGIDIDNHPNYKLNDKMDLFGVSIVENVPQQPSGSLDCDLYMVMYAECLTFGEAILCIDLDPDLIRIRYASLLWDYGTRKANAKAQSDDEVAMRPLRITELTEVTEVVDI
ncbi:hypothetical protein FXO38_02599 [Capsicum annuum]|nr:hypothetical protein FXO38_02599 [Capsicum annuum]